MMTRPEASGPSTKISKTTPCKVTDDWRRNRRHPPFKPTPMRFAPTRSNLYVSQPRSRGRRANGATEGVPSRESSRAAGHCAAGRDTPSRLRQPPPRFRRSTQIIPQNQPVAETSPIPVPAPLPNASRRFKRRHPERWPSGLRRTLGKRVCGKPYRGFESHSLRQASQKMQQIQIVSLE